MKKVICFTAAAMLLLACKKENLDSSKISKSNEISVGGNVVGRLFASTGTSLVELDKNGSRKSPDLTITQAIALPSECSAVLKQVNIGALGITGEGLIVTAPPGLGEIYVSATSNPDPEFVENVLSPFIRKPTTDIQVQFVQIANLPDPANHDFIDIEAYTKAPSLSVPGGFQENLDKYFTSTTVVYALNTENEIYLTSFNNNAIANRCNTLPVKIFDLDQLVSGGKFKLALEAGSNSLFAWEANSGRVFRLQLRSNDLLSHDANYFSTGTGYGDVGTMYQISTTCTVYKRHSFSILGDPDNSTSIKNGTADAILYYENCPNNALELFYNVNSLNTDHKNNTAQNILSDDYFDFSSGNTSFFNFEI